MRLEQTFTSTLLVAALALTAAPAGAQGRENSGDRRGGARNAVGAQSSRQERTARAQPRQAPRGNEGRPNAVAPNAPRGNEGRSSAVAPNAPRGNESRSSAVAPNAPRAAAPPAARRAPRAAAPPAATRTPRSGGGGGSYSAPAPSTRGGQYGTSGGRRNEVTPRAVPRPSYQPPPPRYDARRGPSSRVTVVAPRAYVSTRHYVRPYRYTPYRPYSFGRPYYSFVPRLSIGFGLWIGNSVAYPWAHLGSYRPRVYGYYSGGAYGMAPSMSIYGGVSFDIEPYDADLFVDGEYVGRVGDFSPHSEPLTLTPGEHRIALQRDGFLPMEWVVTVEPGVVIPYHGEMERY